MRVNIWNFNFEVETVRDGRSGAFTDYEYYYIITDKSEKPMIEATVRSFCIHHLQYGVEKPESQSWADPIIKRFEKTAPRQYVYHVVKPHTD